MPSTLRWLARATMLGLIAFSVYYPYKLLVNFWPFTFSGPTSWQMHWMVDDTVLVPFWGRLMHFLLWMPTAVATEIMIFSAIYLVWLFQRNVLFERRTVRVLKWVGASAAMAAAFSLVAIAVDAWWLTGWNTVLANQPVRFHFESGEMGVLFCGLGLFLLALILDMAVLKQRENEEMV